MHSPDCPKTPAGTNILLKGRLLMMSAGAGNKFVSRHVEIHPGKLHVLLDGTSDPQNIISLEGCALADVPEHPQLGFALCRSFSDTEPSSPSRLGQMVFLCFRVEHKQMWMEKIQEEIWKASGGDADGEGAMSSAAKQSKLNKLRFSAASYTIDRGARPALCQGFVLKRTGNFLQDYVVRWCELRDRISTETPTALGGIIYASYISAPPGEWSVVPMRVDTKIERTVPKNRVSISGPNQDSVFFKFKSAAQLEEWASALEMLVERAKIENDPKFQMDMKLGDFSSKHNQGRMSREEQDEFAETMNVAQLKKMQLGWNDDDDDEGGGGNVAGLRRGYDSDDDAEDGDSDGDESDTAYEVRDLAAESPQRVHFIRTLHSIERGIHADRDSASVVPMLQEVIASPPSRFRPEISPYVPHNQRRRGDSGAAAALTAPSFQAHDVSSAFSSYDPPSGVGSNEKVPRQHQHDDEAPPASPAAGEAQANVEDVLVRFERRLFIATELLGPSQVVQRLLKELDTDAADLRYVATHLVDTFPRELKAALIAARLDDALQNFMAIRESVLVRADMARFREEFRIGGPSSTAAGSASSPILSNIAAARGVIPRVGKSTADSAANLTVDDALKIIQRIAIDGKQQGAGKGTGSANGGGSEATHRLRDTIQFLTHFMTQFRETFDVYDDAGYIIEEVTSAIEAATNFLQEV